MNFSCDQCRKAYTIADEKVAGRSFRVTCKQCGHVIQVRAAGAPTAPAAPPAPSAPGASRPAPAAPTAPRAAPAAPPRPPPVAATPQPPPPVAAPPPAPRLPEAPPAPVLPAPGAPPRRTAPPSPDLPPPPDVPLEHQVLDTTAQHDLFFASQPTHRPRAPDEAAPGEAAPAQGPQRPTRRIALAAVALVAVAAAGSWAWVTTSSRRPAAAVAPAPPGPPPPGQAAQPGPAAQPGQAAQPGPAAPAPAEVAQPAPVPLPAEPASEAPPEPRGAAAPRPRGGQAGFESVGAGGAGADAREKLRQRNLTIAKKDKKLLDLLEKKQDAAPARAAPVARTELDTGRTELDADAVKQTMAGSQGAYSACVSRALKEQPGLRLDGKRATLMLTIKPSGVVQSAWIAEAELDKSPLGKCLAGVARRMVFPAFSGEPIDVSAPLALSATR